MRTTIETVQGWGFYKNPLKDGLYIRETLPGYIEYWNPEEPQKIVIRDYDGVLVDIFLI
jgi:hypothetical protein